MADRNTPRPTSEAAMPRRRRLPWLLALIAWGALGAAAPALRAGEQTITFTGSDGVRLEGTLARPEGATDRDVPALLLLQGGGPIDRDGNQAPRAGAGLMKALADALAGRGIASLRFDKRGMHANARTLPARESEWSRFFRWEAFTGDATAAFARLTATPGIAIGRVGILGHGEGGLLGLTASALLGRHPPGAAALVLIGTPGRPARSVIREQLALALLDMEIPPAEAETLTAASDDIIATIQAKGTVPPAVPARLGALYPPYLGPFLRSLLAIDPAAFAWNFAGPVLVVNGAEDRRVSAARDAEALRKALTARGSGDQALMIAPGAGHDLSLAGGSAPDVAIIGAVAAWVAGTLDGDRR